MTSSSAPPAPETPSNNDESGDAALLALWEQVDAHWDNEAMHANFLQLAVDRGDLAFAASRYRSELVSEQARRAERAEEQLKKLTALAFAQIDASRTPPPNSKRLMTWIALVVSLGLLGSCFYALTL